MALLLDKDVDERARQLCGHGDYVQAAVVILRQGSRRLLEVAAAWGLPAIVLQAEVARVREALHADAEQIAGIARGVSQRYAARCYGADPTDLYQQAYTIVLEVRRGRLPQLQDGTIDRNAFGAWAWTAAMRRLSRYLWRQSSPVSASDHACQDLVHVHQLALAGHCMPGCAEDEKHSGHEAHAAELGAEQRFGRVQVRLRLRQCLRELCGDDDWTSAVMDVLLQGKRLEVVASRRGLPLQGLIGKVRRAKRLCRADARVRQLVVELAELDQ